MNRMNLQIGKDCLLEKYAPICTNPASHRLVMMTLYYKMITLL